MRLARCGRSAVAQIFNLQYRRIVFGGASVRFHASAPPNVWQSATLRYSRVQLCATDMALNTCRDIFRFRKRAEAGGSNSGVLLVSGGLHGWTTQSSRASGSCYGFRDRGLRQDVVHRVQQIAAGEWF